MILSNVEIDNDDSQNYLDYNEVVDIAKKQVRNDTRYCSWSQYCGDSETFAENSMEHVMDIDFGVIIEANVKGLNYNQFLMEYDPEFKELAEMENEVIATSSNYTIIALTIKQNGTVYLYNDDNPCTISYSENDISIE
jgi:hypothetical protein